MLEATSLRSRKHSTSTMDIKHNNKALSTTNDSTGIISQSGATTTAKKANRDPASGAGAGAVGFDIMQDQTPSEADNLKRQSENASRSIGKGLTREKLSAEDLNGGLLDGALDDVDDEDLDGDTEDTEMAHEGDGVFADQDNDDDERQLESSQQPATEDESQTDAINGAEDTIVSSEDQEDASHDDDDDEGPTADNEDEEEEEGEEEEEEATPAAHSEDEGSELHDEESHHEGGDEDDDVEDVDEDDESVTPVVKKDVPPTFSQKPTLNRPQLIAEELNSGDDLSDLSDFEDTDDSEDEEHSVAKGSGKAKTESAAVSETRAKNSRPAFGRKRSLRETSRDSKGQEDIMKKEADDEYEEENNGRQSDKESESEIAEGEEAEEHRKVECDDDAEEEEEEEEDLEKKHLHMDALQALTTIEIEFATLRDKMYDERMRELDKEVEMINDGTHPELSTLMREIEEKREKRLRIAKAWRTHMGEIAQCGFEVKEYQAHCTFQSKKREMRVDLIADLGRKQRKLTFEKAMSTDSYCKNGVVSDKAELVRARKQRRSMVNELRAVKQQQHGFPASSKLRMVTSTELDEDFEAMGLPRPTPQTNSADHGLKLHLGGHSGYAPLTAPAESSPRPSNSYRWTAPVEYTSGPRPGVEIYVDGNRCKIDGIWYKPNDAVAVLDAVYGQYNARYLYQENDQSASTTTIRIASRNDSKTGQSVALWQDIVDVFGSIKYVMYDGAVVSPMTDDSFCRLVPSRTAFQPGIVAFESRRWCRRGGLGNTDVPAIDIESLKRFMSLMEIGFESIQLAPEEQKEIITPWTSVCWRY
ncbi:hypothetical protein BGZ51_007789 [Haplosporangium sp. Z 767]|nr:hypothetical protein BGZ51_007789 [Haplosporangium sp. Z 767]